ncbi:Beta-glucan synthesis-associated protein SKN1 [Phytophthora cinnamomi]|uniref:Beta-glucan synthesis-associated protein SKN1 n=1 Tax=Phytophthora cinnamomi TaxID=4785 RepID=UPI003559E9C8|nr:Beta-glucan synthesis-associated protein SKN1 [Phytophthora cinnamomi]
MGKNNTLSGRTFPTKSGIKPWVDPDTPTDRRTYTSSRGRQWDLVMSDEFNVANRSFRPGDDHMWTSLEKPDGVNGALELYSHNMTSTKCDDDGTCYFYIKSVDEVNVIHVYNMYTHPPGFTDANFFYRSAMVQSWNKFCYQGGMLEVRAQLPGAVSKASGNPDLALGKSGKVATSNYYPTWPGIWMMGNLGRAIFSASTNRMWPFSYNKCDPDVFNSSNQRISACDANPGYGLNPNQGRGAPEIDVLEGGGLAISSSLQIAPGMPDDYRLISANTSTGDYYSCFYSYGCQTPGANNIDVPTAYYQRQRGHKSWYQGLRYASNNECMQSSSLKQSYNTIASSMKAGITENSCSLQTCPASFDVHTDVSLIDGTENDHWGINSNGTCFPVINSYMGAYLCDPDNTNSKCASPRSSSTPKSSAMSPFNYQMDAISSNWPIHLGAYVDFVVYQLEWVTGKKGYNAGKTNPEKLMLEEPMYVIFNVALSATWGAKPPNPGQECRGDGKDEAVNKICDSFPMFMKVDYIRLYQDHGDGLDADNYMQVGMGADTDAIETETFGEHHTTAKAMRVAYQLDVCKSDKDNIVLIMDYAQNLAGTFYP